MERENMIDHAAEIGSYMMDGLESLYTYPNVGDVRGLGMIAGIELVKDKKTIHENCCIRRNEEGL